MADDSRMVREEEQLSLTEAIGNDDAIKEATQSLKLDSGLDFEVLLKDGTLVSRVQGLDPLKNERAAQKAFPSPTGLTKDPKAYAAIATVWQKSGSSAFETARGKLVIPVCWSNPAPDNEHGRELTRLAIKATWEYHGVVEFAYWNECNPDSQGIKINIADERPWSVYGNFADSENPSMTLNFIFNVDSMAGCKTIADRCIWSIAVHEFGHALGMIHEQDSNNTPDWCKKQNPGVTPLSALKAKMITDWDPYSVMNYCFDIYSRRVQLSDCDIAAYHKLYGKPERMPYQPTCTTK